MNSSIRIRSPKTLRKLFNEYKNAIIITHKYADVDALASAISFRHILKNKLSYDNVLFLCPDGINSSALKLTERLGIKTDCLRENSSINENSFSPENTIVLLLDVGGCNQLANFEEILKTEYKKILIDHHYQNDLVEKVNYVFMPSNAFSTSEITTIVFRDMIDDEKIASLLVAGIIHDTSRFKRASYVTFKSMSYLAKIVSYEKLVLLMREDEELSKRMAKLKAAQRVIISRIGNLIITVTFVSNFESDIASSLINLGSDMVIVVSPKENETRIVVKSTRSISIDIWKKAIELLVKELGPVSYGGHFGASILVLKEVFSKRELPGLCKKISNLLAQGLFT